MFTRVCGKQLQAAKVTFGAQPTEPQVYAYLLQNWKQLRFGTAVEAGTRTRAQKSPKRRQREARQQTAASGIGTKSQQALKQARADTKQERQRFTRAQKEALAKMRFSLRNDKRKQKHKGR